jgi:hypothetical protein
MLSSLLATKVLLQHLPRIMSSKHQVLNPFHAPLARVLMKILHPQEAKVV